jgi:hypothetical protein
VCVPPLSPPLWLYPYSALERDTLERDMSVGCRDMRVLCVGAMWHAADMVCKDVQESASLQKLDYHKLKLKQGVKKRSRGKIREERRGTSKRRISAS